jgi:hypothetical protein
MKSSSLEALSLRRKLRNSLEKQIWNRLVNEYRKEAGEARAVVCFFHSII